MLGYGMWGNLYGNVDGRHPSKYLQDNREISGDILTNPG